MTAGPNASHNPTWLHRFAVGTAVATWFLVVAGALVTSNNAGLSVPDWPLSYGTWMPPMVGGILYEHGHRMVASLIGLLTIIQAVWLWRREPRRWVRRLGFVALLAVVIQGILGGVTVLYLLPAPVSVAHACLAQLFFCAMVSIALVTSPGWKQTVARVEDTGTPRLSVLCLLASAAVFLQLVLGAMLRHGAVGIGAHVAGAVAAGLGVGWTVAAVCRRPVVGSGLGPTAGRLLGLLIVQLMLGAGAYWIRVVTQGAVQPEPAMVVLTVLHVAVGALVLAASVVLTFEVYRRLTPAGQALELSPLAQKATP